MDRIQELILAAQQQAAKETIANSFAYENLVYTKFAELIIRECSLIPDWCIETGKDQFVETCMAERTSKMIKQHFGVEQ